MDCILASYNITYRNGHSTSIRSWHGGWTRETSPTEYAADGTRFAKAAPVLYNFWSSGDEVLEIASDADISVTSGIEWDWSFDWWPVSVKARRYVWHKQALFKGRSWLYGTTWAGWGFREWYLGGRVYSVAQANALDDDTLRTDPVFRHSPDEMFIASIDKGAARLRFSPQYNGTIAFVDGTPLSRVASLPRPCQSGDWRTNLRETAVDLQHSGERYTGFREHIEREKKNQMRMTLFAAKSMPVACHK